MIYSFFSHYYNGDKMNKKDWWLLFKKTGKIVYYLNYINSKKEAVDDNDKKG